VSVNQTMARKQKAVTWQPKYIEIIRAVEADGETKSANARHINLLRSTLSML